MSDDICQTLHFSATVTEGSTRFRLPGGAKESKRVDPKGTVTKLFRPYAN